MRRKSRGVPAFKPLRYCRESWGSCESCKVPLVEERVQMTHSVTGEFFYLCADCAFRFLGVVEVKRAQRVVSSR